MIKTILAFPKIARNRLFKVEERISNSSAQRDRIPAILFILTVFFYVAYQLAMQPGWVLGGEMWAEMATNYFTNANSPSYIQKLFATDAGYIPAALRLIALTGNLFNLPADSIPYFYTWSAIILTGMMIGAFCLAQFRKLVRNDVLRFLTAISILVVADFETRTFINFTYFAAFFVAIVTALALVNDTEDVPWWAWFIPLLMVSKPAVLAALPAMIVVAMVSKPRFRWITITVFALCIGQFIQMVISQKGGVVPQTIEITFLSKVFASFEYFFGFLGGYVFGPNFQFEKNISILAGVCIFFASALVVFKKRNNSSALMLVGLSLLFFNILLNCFALSDAWNRDMARLAGLPVYRHIIVGFFGCVLVTLGLFVSLTDYRDSKYKAQHTVNFGLFIFVLWFVGSGWFSFGGKISREPEAPLIKNSQWQKMAAAIDSGRSPLCVPIDPFGLTYSRNCTVLNPELNFTKPYRFEVVQPEDNLSVLEVTPPAQLSEKTLVSLAVLAQPFTTQNFFVTVKANIHLKDGSIKFYSGGRDLTISGGLILLTGNDRILISNISSIRFVFNSPVKIAIMATEQNSTPAILWMGLFNVAQKYEGRIVRQAPSNRGKEDGWYLVKNGKRSWITDATWLTKNGYQADSVIEISNADFNAIPEDSATLH